MLAELKIKIDANTQKLNELENKIDRIKNKSKKIDGGGFKNMTSSIFTAIGAMQILNVAVDKTYQLLKNSVLTFAEFEKYSAVLRTAFGNIADSQLAMQQITDFAKKTPFQVSELTASYIKLKNRGIQPTTKELTKMGDIAASQGKSFDQLTEAILDAMTGENERLKEFGIKAASSGNKMKFTFKGITKEVEKTDEAIKDAIMSFGDIEGIKGSMSNISVTMSGQWSNLQDNLENFYRLVGDKLQPTLLQLIGTINNAINFFNSNAQRNMRFENYQRNLKEIKTLQLQAGKGTTEEEKAAYNKLISIYPALATDVEQGTQEFKDALAVMITDLTSESSKLISNYVNKNIDDLTERVNDAQTDFVSAQEEMMNRNSEMMSVLSNKNMLDELETASGLDEVERFKYLSTLPEFYNGFDKFINEYQSAQQELTESQVALNKAITQQAKREESANKKLGSATLTSVKKLIGESVETPSPKTEPTTTTSTFDKKLESSVTSKQNVYTINVDRLINIEDWNTEMDNKNSQKLLDDIVTNALKRLLNDTQQN